MARTVSRPLARALLGGAITLASVSCTPVAQRPLGVAAGGRAHIAAGGARVVAVARDTAAPAAILLAPPPSLDAAAPALPIAAPPFRLADTIAPETAARAAECLTAAVYYEARSEPVDGQRAVAQVVLNRVRNPAFPASVCGVVYQHAANGCQFSFSCDGSTAQPRDRIAWARAEEIANRALAGDVYEPAGAATFYHTRAVSPWWAASLARVATIGAHIFYRLGDGWRGALDFRQSYAAAEPADGAATDDAGLAENVRRYAFAGVTVHSGNAEVAVAIAGVTVHRGAAGPDDADRADTTEGAGDTGVRVHAGAPPAVDGSPAVD